MKYLLDTDACITLLRGRDKSFIDAMGKVGLDDCAISEITKVELLYGCAIAEAKGRRSDCDSVLRLLSSVRTIPISVAISEFVRQKVRLTTLGTVIEDFDLLIACTALSSGYMLVTGNHSHMSRVQGLMISDVL